MKCDLMLEKTCQSSLYILSKATHKYNSVCSNMHFIGTRGYTVCVIQLEFLTVMHVYNG